MSMLPKKTLVIKNFVLYSTVRDNIIVIKSKFKKES